MHVLVQRRHQYHAGQHMPGPCSAGQCTAGIDAVQASLQLRLLLTRRCLPAPLPYGAGRRAGRLRRSRQSRSRRRGHHDGSEVLTDKCRGCPGLVCNTFLHPCGYLVCSSCAEEEQDCPTCRTAVQVPAALLRLRRSTPQHSRISAVPGLLFGTLQTATHSKFS